MDLRQLFQIRSNTCDVHAGDVLLSEPTMGDLHFGRSVVLVIDHSETEGTFGIILNKPLRYRLNEIVESFNEFGAPVFLGGPVAENQVFFVHTLGDLIPDSCPVKEGLYWGGDANVLNTLMEQGIANQENVRFFLGYSGWEQGQLLGELEHNTWVVCNASAKTLLSTPTDQLWKTLLDRMGGRYALWNRFPKNPEEN